VSPATVSPEQGLGTHWLWTFVQSCRFFFFPFISSFFPSFSFFSSSLFFFSEARLVHTKLNNAALKPIVDIQHFSHSGTE
jgi:hypothetical protein